MTPLHKCHGLPPDVRVIDGARVQVTSTWDAERVVFSALYCPGCGLSLREGDGGGAMTSPAWINRMELARREKRRRRINRFLVRHYWLLLWLTGTVVFAGVWLVLGAVTSL